MGLEEKGRNDAVIAAAAAHRPKEIGILIGICCDKAPVSQNHVHSQKIINGKATLPRQMADATAKR